VIIYAHEEFSPPKLGCGGQTWRDGPALKAYTASAVIKIRAVSIIFLLLFFAGFATTRKTGKPGGQ